MITYDRLIELLKYDKDTGYFYWVNPTNPRIHKNDIAGHIGNSGKFYHVIKIDKKAYRAHRLAWLYMTKKMPKICIDHINGDTLDNRWINLREASILENNRNICIGRKKGSGLLLGVRKIGDRYIPRIRVNGKLLTLGSYRKEVDAHNAYINARREYFGEFNRL